MKKETDFDKILKVTRWAKRDAENQMVETLIKRTYPSLNSVLGFSIGLMCTYLSCKAISHMFSGHKAVVAANWYSTVYELRLRR
ncbi:MAG: hypothetical protein WC455_13160 [Dehalococcoidia bacterium]|jgi:hypothetical protein